MRIKPCLLILLFAPLHVFAQCDAGILLNQNNINTNVYNDGLLFWDIDNDNFPAIFSSGLWLGGVQPSGQLSVAAAMYPSDTQKDYWAGPLNPNDGTPLIDGCDNYNKFWEVSREDIINHNLDFLDNGIIDNPIDHIFAFPCHGNASFETYNGFELPDTPQGLAAFRDLNNNEIYEPDQGEYPLPSSLNEEVVPAQMVFSIFNDATNPHTQSQGEALKFEIQFTAWTFDCLDNEILNNTIFTNHKIISRRDEPLDSVQIGLWVDFKIGCFADDLIGTSYEQNSFYGYNQDTLDGINLCACQGTPTYCQFPPAQSITFLNQDLSQFMFMMNGSFGILPPEISDPTQPDEYYNYLTGTFKDGTPLTSGGSGYDPNSTNTTNFAFPGNPINAINEWTMYDLYDAPNINSANGDARGIGSLNAGTIAPAEVVELDMAISFHQGDEFDYLQNVNLMLDNLPTIQEMYDNGFLNYCTPDMSSAISEKERNEINIFPNPVSDNLNVELFENDYDEIQIIDMMGRNVFAKSISNISNIEIPTNDLPSGIYFLLCKNKEETVIRKFVIDK